MVKTPQTHRTKQILADVLETTASGPVSEPRETDIPEHVQDEIRALAALEGERLSLKPSEEIVEEEALPATPEELEAEEEDAEAEAEPEVQDEQEEPEEKPKPQRPPRRFEFRVEAPTLKAFAAQLEHLADEVRVHAAQDGWHVLAVDPAHVAMVDLRLDRIDCAERRDGVAHERHFGAGSELRLRPRCLSILRFGPRFDPRCHAALRPRARQPRVDGVGQLIPGCHRGLRSFLWPHRTPSRLPD